MRRLVVALTLVVAAVIVVGDAPLHADDGIPPLPFDFLGREFECFGTVPHVPIDPLRTTITADVVVARDGVTDSRARHIVNSAEVPYGAGVVPQLTPDVDLNIVAVHDVTGALASATDEVVPLVIDPGNAKDLMSSLIRYYRQKYPTLRRDHVHLVTSRDIFVDSGGEEIDAVLGIANCIGSIGDPGLSFTIGEAGPFEPAAIGPLTFFKDIAKDTAAHEIGHAFGAHHHYANCAENAGFALAEAKGDVCTLMFNDASLIGMRFSQANSAAVRGSAEAHL